MISRRTLHRALALDLAAFTERCFHAVVPGESFLPNWHIDAIAYALERVMHGDVRRLIITMPPRSMKSLCVSVAFPAFVLGHDASRKIITVSYAEGLALKHARDTRAIMASDWYQQVFPGTRIDPAKDSVPEFATTSRGFRLSTSVGGTLTGRGGNLIIVDDPIKPQDAMSEPAREAVHSWFSNTLLSRLDNKETDAIIIVMQRVHVDDLAGYLLEAGGWELLNLRAIAEQDENIPIGPGKFHAREAGAALHPARESLETLQTQKLAMGSLDFAAQYQQAPVPLEGAMIKRGWLRHFTNAPARESGDLVVLSWDTAMKANERADYSVCTAWLIRGEANYLIDLHRERLDFPDLKRKAVALHERWQPTATLVEDKGSGTSLIQELRTAGMPVIAWEARGDKEMRMSAQSARFEAGAVLFPREAPWLNDLLAELLAFPGGRHDDQVDSISQALEWAQQYRWRPRPRIRLL